MLGLFLSRELFLFQELFLRHELLSLVLAILQKLSVSLLCAGFRLHKILLVPASLLTVTQTLKYSLFLDFLGFLDDGLDGKVFVAKLLRFCKFQAVQESVFPDGVGGKVFLQKMKDGNGKPDRCKLPLNDNKMEEVFDIGDRKGVNEKCDKPLKNPNLVGQPCRLQIFITLRTNFLRQLPK